MSTELIELPFISRTYCDGCAINDGYGTPMKYYDRKNPRVCM